MARVLVTGMSGAGKSTLLKELRRRGVLTVDTDYDGWVLPDGTWDEGRIAGLLAAHHDLVVSGTVSNQGLFYDWFEHVVLLTAPLEVLLDRVRRRSNNPYGRTVQQRREIRQYVEEVRATPSQGCNSRTGRSAPRNRPCGHTGTARFLRACSRT